MSNLPSEPAALLDPVERLALSYAASSARPAWEALQFFHHRLADVARPGREPLMIQLRLSWWRDRLSEPAERWPKGEPLLARLQIWEAEAKALIGLVDGWEARIVGEDGGAELARATIEAYTALARLVDEPDHAAVRLMAEQLAQPELIFGPTPRLSRKMRPLSVLRAYAMRTATGGKSTPWIDLILLMRVGLLGR